MSKDTEIIREVLESVGMDISPDDFVAAEEALTRLDAKSAEAKIEAYAKSIGLGGSSVDFNVESLIKAHMNLRELNGSLIDLRQEAFDKGIEAGKHFAEVNLYFTVERLREMSLKELTLILSEDV